MRRPRRSEQAAPAPADLSVIIEQVADCWGWAPIFVDLAMVGDTPFQGTMTRNVQRFFEALAVAGVHPIPVTSPSRPANFQNALQEIVRVLGTGLAVRVPVANLQAQTAARDLRALITRLGLDLGIVDIVVEYGLAGAADPSFSYLCDRLPDISQWRTFTVLRGSFPPNLMGLKRPGQYEVQREEWKRWMAEASNSAALPRCPSFGDYTIQHPIYHEPVQGANPSASIRYTIDTYWVVMRGEGLRTPGSAGHAQYRANAELLCDRKEFCGPQFSDGDGYIWDVSSRKKPGPGTPETWLRAGINHHLTFVARQIPAWAGAADTVAGR